MPLILIVSIIAIAIGLFIFLKSASAIEIQRRFYEKINWRIEPVSMEKELRNTRLMGLFLIIATAVTLIYIFIKWQS